MGKSYMHIHFILTTVKALGPMTRYRSLPGLGLHCRRRGPRGRRSSWSRSTSLCWGGGSLGEYDWDWDLDWDLNWDWDWIGISIGIEIWIGIGIGLGYESSVVTLPFASSRLHDPAVKAACRYRQLSDMRFNYGGFLDNSHLPSFRCSPYCH